MRGELEFEGALRERVGMIKGLKSASSSRHSQPMMVESMSATSSRLRRPSAGWTQTSSGKNRTASCTRARSFGSAPSAASTIRSAARSPSAVRPTTRRPSPSTAWITTVSGTNTASGGATRVTANCMGGGYSAHRPGSMQSRPRPVPFALRCMLKPHATFGGRSGFPSHGMVHAFGFDVRDAGGL